MLDSIPIITLAGIAIVFGFAGLVWSADRFVAGAASMAEAFGIAPMIVGLTIVSFGTSAPEVMVSLVAATQGAGDLAVGNAIGSNIANIGLVLGITTLVCKIPVQFHLLKHESMILFIVYVASGYFLYNSHLDPIEGWLLLGLLVPSMWFLITSKRHDYRPDDIMESEVAHYGPKIAIFWFIVGLVALIFSSKILVWGAEQTALYFHVSPLIIGLSVIAVGTSLPELAASLMSALKGHHDIAVGNIIGSNIFNLLAVMSIPGIFGSPAMEASVFSRDYASMVIITLLLIICIALVIALRKSAAIGRFTGTLLLSCYIAYIFFLSHSQL